jgi:hypothetical protein
MIAALKLTLVDSAYDFWAKVKNLANNEGKWPNLTISN